MNDGQSCRQSKRQLLRSEWSGHVREYELSGLSGAAFCRERGLSVRRLYYWIRVLGSTHKEDFVELSPMSMASDSGVRLSCGRVSVHLSAGFDASVLRRVLEVLS